MPLYGQELTRDISPIEAGLSYFVKTAKTEAFNGQESLLKQKEQGTHKRRYGIVLTDKGIARQGDTVWMNSKAIGVVTSGTKSITLEKAIALILVNQKLAVGTDVALEVRGKQLQAETVKLPFYKREK